ncbi:TerB family tellurite resistance protein [Roseivirga sp. BDSF3-8]|uniref:TerB family tellurite resistance protein n=1 Tax=Roseivirga sp. BDSF3-8 TaxID=3241598 RepID=UPI003531DB4C
MKKILCTGLMALTFSLTLFPQAKAQEIEVAQLLLNVEKLAQLKEMLQHMYQGYRTLENGYQTVKGIAEGDFKLHDLFLSELLKVSSTVRDYRRVAELVAYQRDLAGEYRRAFKRFTSSGHYTEAELRYLEKVYTHLLQRSLNHLEELAMILTAGELRMNDSERLEAIDHLHADMGSMLSFLRQFNEQVSALGHQRKKITEGDERLNQWVQ